MISKPNLGVCRAPNKNHRNKERCHKDDAFASRHGLPSFLDLNRSRSPIRMQQGSATGMTSFLISKTCALPIKICNIWADTSVSAYRKKAKVRLLFKTVFDCRQKISNKRRIKINPL
jgi:hypothetical protein